MNADLWGLAYWMRQRSDEEKRDGEEVEAAIYRECAGKLEAALSVAQGQGGMVLVDSGLIADAASELEDDAACMRDSHTAWDAAGKLIAWPDECVQHDIERISSLAARLRTALPAAPAQPDGVSK